MAQTTTIILLPQTPQTSGVPVTGETVPAASYYLGNKNLSNLSFCIQGEPVNIWVSSSGDKYR